MNVIKIFGFVWGLKHSVAQLAGAVEYTDCFSAEGKDSPTQRVS